MTSITPFQATDLFEINAVNLDTLTENFQLFFYLQYLTDWPSLFFKSNSLNQISGYMMGKTEGKGKDWHTHITAVTINPTYRRLGLASELCDFLKKSTESEPYNAYFIDLFVKCNNKLAITLYEKLGYSIYRRVIGYYSGSSNDDDFGDAINKKKKKNLDDDADAFDMRLSLKRDVKNESVREHGEKFHIKPSDIRF